MNRGTPGDDEYGPADTVATFAAANGLVLRGHNLLVVPPYAGLVFRPARPTPSRSGPFSTTSSNWPAGTAAGSTAGTLSTSRSRPRTGGRTVCAPRCFSRRFGPEYLDLAYHAARDADPDARLVVKRIRCRARRAGAGSAPHRAAPSARADATIRDAGRCRRHPSPSDGGRRTALFGTAAAAVSRRHRGPRPDDPDHRARRHRRECTRRRDGSGTAWSPTPIAGSSMPHSTSPRSRWS